MKIVTVLGARPQFIKAGSVSREIERHPELTEVIVHTGQHYDTNMSDVFFDQMRIPRPDYRLDVHGVGHGAMTGRMLEKIEAILLEERPDWVLVYGDTNSTLAGALAASKLHIRIAHVEAGLRSFNMRMPEEVNRILTDRLSSVLFCPTQTAVGHLRDEGFERFGCDVVLSGDVMQDGADFYASMARQPEVLDASDSPFLLCTVHRAENTDDPERLSGIVEALNAIAAQTRIVLPLHPRTRERLRAANLTLAPGIERIEPVGYLEMIWLLKHCTQVMTDSGGLQKEAYFFRKPCITMRDETEWTELVACGCNRLVGARTDAIVDAATHPRPFPEQAERLYGDGRAGRRIVETLLERAERETSDATQTW